MFYRFCSILLKALYLLDFLCNDTDTDTNYNEQQQQTKRAPDCSEQDCLCNDNAKRLSGNKLGLAK